MAGSGQILVITRASEVVQAIEEQPHDFGVSVMTPDHLEAREVAGKYPVVIFDRQDAEVVSRLGSRLRELDEGLEFLVVVDAAHERDGIAGLHVGAHDYLVWKPSQAGVLCDVIGRLLLASGRGGENLAPSEGAFGPYELYRRLAVGGMAEVYLARTGEDEAPLVIKRMRPELATNPEFQTMFLDEARISSQLDHPNIVRVRNFGEIDGHFFIALDYIPGCNLAHLGRLLRWRIPLVAATTIVREICAALAYAHDATAPDGSPLEIVHRDVGPPNVLVSLDGRVMLADFGIAKATERQTETVVGVLKGRADYMSPEQIAGYPLDRRSDLFATGVMLYQLVAGCHPFRGMDNDETLNNIRVVDPQPPSFHNVEVNEDLDRIVMEALAKKPEHRYPDAEAFQEDLDEWIETAGGSDANVVRALLEEALGLDEGGAFEAAEAVSDLDELSGASGITGIPGIIPSQEWLHGTSGPSHSPSEITRLGPDNEAEATPIAAAVDPEPQSTPQAVARPVEPTGAVPDRPPSAIPTTPSAGSAGIVPGEVPMGTPSRRSHSIDRPVVEDDRPSRSSTARPPVFPQPENPSRSTGFPLWGWAAVAVGSVVAFVVILGVFLHGPEPITLDTPPPTAANTPTRIARHTSPPTPEPTPTIEQTLPATPEPTLQTTPRSTTRPTRKRTPTVRRTPRRTATPAPTPRALRKGKLSIWVDSWATVSIDGKPLKVNAPVVGIPVVEGSHRVTLENSALGVRKELDVVIRPGKETRVNVRLRK